MELITGENDDGRRLDRILRKALPDCSLPLIHRLLRKKLVFVDGKPGKAPDRVGCGAKIEISSLENVSLGSFSGKQTEKTDFHLVKSENSLSNPDIIWEGRGLLAVNKPVGLSVHGTNSLDTTVRSYLADKLPVSLSFKPGPLHRLDKPSSGIVVFSASLQGARLFSSLLHEHKVCKTYLAIVEGRMENETIWQDRLKRDKNRKKTYVSNEQNKNSGGGLFGKTAITKVSPLAVTDNYSLIKAEIVTGRTHQIRAQAAAAGFPLLRDLKYGAKNSKQKIKNINIDQKQKFQNNSNKQIAEFFLHAWKLEFLEYSIEAPLPEAFKKKIVELFNKLPE